MPTISDQLRTAIQRSPLAVYELEKQAGVGQGAILRFMHGQTGLRSESIDKIAAILGLNLTTDRPKLTSKKARKKHRPRGRPRKKQSQRKQRK